MNMKRVTELFEKSVTGVVEQGEASVNEKGYCSYRGPKGLKCAIGQILPDNLYHKKYDRDNYSFGMLFSDIFLDENTIKKNMVFFTLDKNTEQFFEELQEIHDLLKYKDKRDFRKHFLTSCQNLAIAFDIDTKFITKLAKDYKIKLET